MEAFICLGVILIAFGAYVLIKWYMPRKWHRAKGVVKKQSDTNDPTFCIETDDGKVGWSPYFKNEEADLSEGDEIDVQYYEKKNGEPVIVPEKSEPKQFVLTNKHGFISLGLGAISLFIGLMGYVS